MQRKVITTCPVCESGLEVTHLTCRTCGSVLQGHFEGCKYCQLPQPLFDFLESFVKCRGVIRDLEKEIGMSYPAIKSRIERLLAAAAAATGSGRRCSRPCSTARPPSRRPSRPCAGSRFAAQTARAEGEVA